MFRFHVYATVYKLVETLHYIPRTPYSNKCEPQIFYETADCSYKKSLGRLAKLGKIIQSKVNYV